MTNLYVHIGHYKTGTTVLQQFMEVNSDILKDNGLVYIQTWRNHSKHSRLAFSILREEGFSHLMYGYNDDTYYLDAWEDVFKEVTENQDKDFLISSEEFMRVGETKRNIEYLTKIKDLASKYNIVIKPIVYLRSPKEHILSWYNQLVKMKKDPTVNIDCQLPPLHNSLGVVEGVHYDIKKAVKPWVDVFGQGNIYIKEYFGKKKGSTYLIEDFLSIFDIELTENYQFIQGDPNPRLDDSILFMVRNMMNLDLPQGSIDYVYNSWINFSHKSDKLVSFNVDNDKVENDALSSVEWLEEITNGEVQLQGAMDGILSKPSSDHEMLKLNTFLYTELIKTRNEIRQLKKMFKKLEENTSK
ncbi:hypothetical protein [Psychrobacter celer]|uniref:hypothetical protein n=1 Tax=Psychrobacter celer TaxID=306572 RepID=UPI0018DFFCA4|nr:hypothetical protein [Psychrobacter celer]